MKIPTADFLTMQRINLSHPSAAIRASVLFSALLCLGRQEAHAQASYLQQGFETGGNTLASGLGSNASGGAGGQYIYTAASTGSLYTGSFLSASGNSANALPNPGTVAMEGNRSFGAVNNTGGGNTTGAVSFNNVSFLAATGNYLQFKIASYQTNSNGGLDNATVNNGVLVEIAYNGSTIFVPTLRIAGLNGGSVFLYSATGIAATTVLTTSPALQTFASPDDRTGNGQSLAITGTAGLSTARINFGPAITQVQVRITIAVNGKTGVFIDDVRIGSNGPLPVELKSFTAEPTASGTQLRWATASENNNLGFDIQRGSNADEFATIARIAGQGTTARSHSYAWLDAQPLVGLSYYRLRQVDTDGIEAFSPVVAVKAIRTFGAFFFPNPTTGRIILTATTGVMRYQVLNPLGQVLLTGEACSGSSIDVAALRPGSYLLELQSAAGRQVQRFVRE